MNRFKTTSLTLLAAGALLAALPAGSYAAKGTHKGAHATKAPRVRVHGKIATVGTESLGVTVKGGTTVTVDFTSSTRFRYNGQPASTAPAFSAGEILSAVGRTNADGSVAAKRLGVINRLGIAGKVAQVGTGTLTITSKSGASVTVSLTSKTRYLVNGALSATAPTFTTGEKIRVLALKNADGSLTARGIAVGKNPNLVRVTGKISAIGTGTLTVTTRKSGTVTVTLTAKTKYIVNRTRNAAAPAFTAGERVRIAGLKSSDGTVTARVVDVVPAGKSGK